LGNLQNTYDMFKLLFFSSNETADDWFDFINKNYQKGIDQLYRKLRYRYHEMLLEIGITLEDIRTITWVETKNFLETDVTLAGAR